MAGCLDADARTVRIWNRYRQRTIFRGRFKAWPIPPCTGQTHMDRTVVRCQTVIAGRALHGNGSICGRRLNASADIIQADRTIRCAQPYIARNVAQTQRSVRGLEVHCGKARGHDDQTGHPFPAVRPVEGDAAVGDCRPDFLDLEIGARGQRPVLRENRHGQRKCRSDSQKQYGLRFHGTHRHRRRREGWLMIFRHPCTGKPMQFDSRYPQAFEKLH